MDIDEAHCPRFPDLDAFDRYREDKRLAALSELRSEAIADARILISGKTKNYNFR